MRCSLLLFLLAFVSLMHVSMASPAGGGGGGGRGGGGSSSGGRPGRGGGGGGSSAANSMYAVPSAQSYFNVQNILMIIGAFVLAQNNLARH